MAAAGIIGAQWQAQIKVWQWSSHSEHSTIIMAGSRHCRQASPCRHRQAWPLLPTWQAVASLHRAATSQHRHVSPSVQQTTYGRYWHCTPVGRTIWASLCLQLHSRQVTPFLLLAFPLQAGIGMAQNTQHSSSSRAGIHIGLMVWHHTKYPSAGWVAAAVICHGGTAWLQATAVSSNNQAGAMAGTGQGTRHNRHTVQCMLQAMQALTPGWQAAIVQVSGWYSNGKVAGIPQEAVAGRQNRRSGMALG